MGASRELDTLTLSTAGGLVYTHCDIANTGGSGLPLKMDTDANGDAWVIGEFHTSHTYVDKSDTPCAPDRMTVPLGAGVKPFWSTFTSNSTEQSELGEDIKVATDGLVWFTQGGMHIGLGAIINHSRIISYDPTPTPTTGTYRAFNIPGNRNEVVGLYLDPANNLVWATEAGFQSSMAAGNHAGYIIAFDPDLAANDTQYTWPGNQDASLQSELCDGSPGAGGAGGTGGAWSEPCDGCFKRWKLPEGIYWPAHLTMAPDGAIWATAFWGGKIVRLDPSTGVGTVYPTHTETSTIGSSPIVGTGPWDIRLSLDNLYVIFTEVFDGHVVRMPLSRWNDSACQSLTFDDVDQTGLVAWYTFDADECATGITDMSGNGHTGTCTSATEPAWVKHGHAWDDPATNYAYSFDGVDDLISLGTNAAFDIASDFTIAARVRHAAVPGNTRASIVTKGDAAYGLGCEGASCDSIDAAYGFTMYPGPTYLDTESGWHDLPWHHLTGVFDDTADTMAVYMDGVLVDTTAQTSVSVDAGVAPTIGGNADDAAADFTGLIDDVRIYSRALSAAEVATIARPGYNPCMEHYQPVTTWSPSFVGYTAYDSAGRLWFTSNPADPDQLAPAGIHSRWGYMTPEWAPVLVGGENVTPQHWLDPPYSYGALAYDPVNDVMWQTDSGGGGAGGTGIDESGVGYFAFE
jgi:hypothetical protein